VGSTLDSGTELLPFGGSAIVTRGFLDEADAATAFDRLLLEVPWEDHDVVVFGRVHREPRRSSWMATDGTPYSYAGRVRVANPFTPLVAELGQRCGTAVGERFDSVLANLYRDGRDGMGWHSDDEALHGREPTIASLSLGAVRRFALRHRHTRETVRIDLEPGSLLVMSGRCQEEWVHSIPKTTRQVGPRINLTFRRLARRER
jgi:alkylated DNA repair dioxygenase AlkB